ncbi:ESAT-6 protein secretion system EspG family protein [Tamaricihabitans halophyticus]|uniref:ESAT-6 protein secretion system EspG family protein n=1 Tax=Tamaricihabitans halophyticus TaxID=1262583 RepID=A0A4R2R4A8_9PSEU|nr:ESX secretion-associated protein EspG [Tamaricihabitans halophyticus]TCP56734.1 ESAT-6 protein secretion system EspG family protein [Tamaricihabitans halophyticus]
MASAEFFTPLALDFLWESMNMGELPYPLRSRSHGRTEDERRGLRHRAQEELRARMILDGQGRLDPRVEDWLILLGRPAQSVDSIYLSELTGAPVVALAAGDAADNAVLAVQDADGLWLRAIPGSALASSIIELLPTHPRGSSRSVTIAATDLHRLPKVDPAMATAGAATGGESGRSGRRRLSATEAPSDPRTAYAQLAEYPRQRGGQIAANSRSSVAGRRRSRVLGWFDNETGRYLSLSRSGPDGSEWVTVSPADAATMRHHIGEMLGSVSAGR